MPPILELRGVTKSYGSYKVVDAFDFIVEQGELRCLLGPNGAGKTTSIDLITGRQRVTEGKIIFGGIDITNWGEHAETHARGRTAMRAYAEHFGEDPERWGLAGLIPRFRLRAISERRSTRPPRSIRRGACGFCASAAGPKTFCKRFSAMPRTADVARETRMARTLFAVDELTGLITATALVKPSKSPRRGRKVGAKEDEGQGIRQRCEP